MHSAHAFNTREFLQQELLVGIHVFHDDFQQVIGGLSGNQMAFQNLWIAANGFLKSMCLKATICE